MRNLIFILFITFSFVSCNLFEEKIEENAIARVQNKILFDSELKEVIPFDASTEDSLLIANNYIQKWIKQNLILEKAELNLKSEQKNFTKQLEDYRNTLVIYTYEGELINQRLDTNVSDQEIKLYYEQNEHNFDLKDDIVKVRYLKVTKQAPNIKKIRKYYKSTKAEDVEQLKEFSHQFAEKFHLNENEWILFDEVLKEVPINVSDKSGYLKNVKYTEIEDSLSYYFVYFKDYKLETDVSPLSFEKKNIKNIIINRRKLELVSKMKQELYQEALQKKEFEIYKNEENKP
ncbi:hypothetical protein FRY74_08510 [Vicingus serpentipes]|jgi:hypothetical protein|uniref:Peptidyl-prolyl cis-trans isomerase n=1 Tax=Vicingus serpentipes TaxID=1926625 RepID=A0A5C6RU23_9FLAO|nr:hypothetical protein [Vicingus serpentipes]TXB65455.1 hypothetical protein FRY74_08510 [Vicingus serpentipes]